MKTRQGFVSNSSTSSFILIGFKANEVDVVDLEAKGFEKAWVYSWYNEDDDPDFIGIVWESNENNADEIPIDFISGSIKNIEEKTGMTPKIYSWGVHQT